MKTVEIKLYNFNELSENVKNKAVNYHRDFLSRFPVEFEDENGEMEESFEDYSDDEVIENIEANEYIYFVDGSLAQCVTYTGKHEKTGITEFNFKGEIYTL